MEIDHGKVYECCEKILDLIVAEMELDVEASDIKNMSIVNTVLVFCIAEFNSCIPPELHNSFSETYKRNILKAFETQRKC